ncbi:DoxX family protein [Haliscomenobacter sp.]|uniref:DoxX family protein n=1 Tax=Haliscomenobacter sp. TaxID=2717303 RepID=UPI00359417DB
MKRITLIYWIVTGLFAAFMIFSSISNVTLAPEAVAMLSDHLGYPKYIIPFLGAAKILGAIAILVPSFRRIKEWAYAGLFFDLVGAFFSLLQVDGPQPSVFFMLIFIGMLLASYFLWHKKIATVA